MKKAEISRNIKTEERIFSTMKFDDKLSERKKGGDQTRSLIRSRISFEFHEIYDDVRFRVSFGEALKRFHTRYGVQNRGHFWNLLCKSINMQCLGNFFDNKK